MTKHVMIKTKDVVASKAGGITVVQPSSGVKAGKFFGYVLDMYADPADVQLRTVKNGPAGLRQDRDRITGYFRVAMRKCFELEKR